MDPNAQGVNNEPGSPPAQGVTTDPPAVAPDVNDPDPSTGNAPVEPAAPAAPAHEQAVPYDRFAEVNQQNAELRAQLEALQTPAQPDASQGELASPYGFDPQQQPQQQQQPLSWDQIEERVSQDMFSKPVQTMTPIVREILQNELLQQRQQDARVRGIPDFQNYEQAFYSVPEELVQQAQNDPTLVKFLLAKHKETLANRGQAPAPAPATQPQTLKPGPFLDSQDAQPAVPAQPGAAPPQNGAQDPMEALREQYRKEGEQRALENLRKQQGVTSEGTASPPASTGPTAELDSEGQAFMRSMGIPTDQFSEVAGRLNSFVQGDKK